MPAGFPELPLRILPVLRHRGRIDCLAVSEPVPVPVNELHNLPLRRLGPESDLADTKPFPVGQFEEANPERVFEKNGQRPSEKPISSVALNSGRPRKRKSTVGVKVQFVPVIVHIGELYQS